jgi:hypothetical protein
MLKNSNSFLFCLTLLSVQALGFSVEAFSAEPALPAVSAIDKNFTGKQTEHYANGKLKYEVHYKNGKPMV